MRQGTTPTYALIIDGYDLTNKSVYVTFRGKVGGVTLTGDRLTTVYDGKASTIAFRLLQEETFELSLGPIDVQVRFIDENGVASATAIGSVINDKVLLNKVIEYKGEAEDG